MGKKLDYEKVYYEFKDKGYTVLVTELPGWDKHIPYQCASHPDKELSITYKKFKEGRGCRYCYHDRKRLDEQVVTNRLKELGFILKEKYTTTKERVQCECIHHTGIKQVKSLREIETHGCRYCYYDSLMLSTDVIYKAFEDAGYTLLEDPTGKNTNEDLKYLCPSHGEQEITYHHLSHGARCRLCRNEEQSRLLRDSVGVNSRRWKGGVSKLQQYFRQPLEVWRDNIFAKDEYRCVVTGKRNKQLQAHHLVPFHQILGEAFDVLGIDRMNRAGDYTQEELEAIRNYVVSKHSPEIGVTLDKKVHDLFHSIYGYAATAENFNEFKNKYELLKDVG